MNVVVVGAGASGLTCAIALARRGIDVTVYERYDMAAKKILVTGNGRCNYWNDDFANYHFHTDEPTFVEEVNTMINKEKVLDFFDGLGIVPTIKNGYYYPMTMQSSSIRNVLLEEVERLKIRIVYNTEVTYVEKRGRGFYIETNNGKSECDALVIACGSNAYYKEDNIGYEICRSLGHDIVDTLPSLVQLVGNNDFYKMWAGVRSQATVTVLVNREIQKTEEGEIMLTDYGVSGICTFNLSPIATRALDNGDRVELNINFLPSISNLFAFLEERNNKLNKELGTLFEGLLNQKIVDVILYRCNLNKHDKWKDLNSEEKEKLVNNLSFFRVNIIGTKGFINAQVSTGGVNTKEIDSQTMESRVCPNLYVIGEMLDVDGDCGGYNLGFAWLTALIAGRSVNGD